MDTGIVESLTKRTSKCLVAMFMSLRLAKMSEIVRRTQDYDFLSLLVKTIRNDFAQETSNMSLIQNLTFQIILS